jgi:hypothetical protein
VHGYPKINIEGVHGLMTMLETMSLKIVEKHVVTVHVRMIKTHGDNQICSTAHGLQRNHKKGAIPKLLGLIAVRRVGTVARITQSLNGGEIPILHANGYMERKAYLEMIERGGLMSSVDIML